MKGNKFEPKDLVESFNTRLISCYQNGEATGERYFYGLIKTGGYDFLWSDIEGQQHTDCTLMGVVDGIWKYILEQENPQEEIDYCVNLLLEKWGHAKQKEKYRSNEHDRIMVGRWHNLLLLFLYRLGVKNGICNLISNDEMIFLDAFLKEATGKGLGRKFQQERDEDAIWLPEHMEEYRFVLDTQRARKYFPKALKAGFIKKTTKGYKRVKGLTKALLAYFLEKVYCDEFPETALNLLFGEKELSRAVYGYKYIKGDDGKPRNSDNVDKLFENEK